MDFRHIPHSYRMEQLRHAKNREGIGLRPVQDSFMGKHRGKIIDGQRNLFFKNYSIGNGKMPSG